MNGLSVLEWVVLACIVLPLALWGSPLRWPRAFIAWRRSRSPAALREATSAAADVAAQMEAMAQPTLLLIPTGTPGFSKLGGEPELPAGTSWPMGGEGPLPLLSQLELGDVRASGGPAWLPESGRLYAFLDEGRIGCADQVRIIYSAGGTGPMAAAPAGARKPSFPERRVAFKRFISAPSLEWLGVDARRLRGADRAVWQGLARLVDAPDPDVLQSRVGGYPDEIQDGRMPFECEHLARDLPPPGWGAPVEPGIARASRSWRLLMQIDSEPALKMNWGDGGRLYVFIREEHARAAEFSRTVTLFQCY
jgi:hypothetical protein